MSEKTSVTNRDKDNTPTIDFNKSTLVKYYDRPPKFTTRKNFQQEANLVKAEIGQIKMTYNDFESTYGFAKELRRKLPIATKIDSQVCFV